MGAITTDRPADTADMQDIAARVLPNWLSSRYQHYIERHQLHGQDRVRPGATWTAAEVTVRRVHLLLESSSCEGGGSDLDGAVIM